MISLLLASDFDAVFHKPSVQALLQGRRRVAFVPTASLHKDYASYIDSTLRPMFQSLALGVDVVELSRYSPSELRVALAPCDIVYVGGGNSFVLLQHMKECGFKQAVTDMLDAGGLYIGSSAGSVVASPDIGFISPMDDPAKAQLTDHQGLGLIDRAFIPHKGNAKHGDTAQMIEQSLHQQNRPAFALRDDQALHIVEHESQIL
ncbi:MAG: Type 1 glutamine amidotransferase-like domain-containing protein [Alphaproteobacteria bacterium]|nr:MAG: Type 1 glutamine amidotransferase-like domain-containing protein [Alphaproteobacteria bacterium]